MEDEALTQKIIGCAMTVHRTLGPGFLESVYQKALAHKLQRAGLKASCEYPIQVIYDGINVGDFSADMLVEDRILIENKSVQNLCTTHEVQLVNYLTATNIETGLLLNFGDASLQFKRKTRTYRPPRKGSSDRIIRIGQELETLSVSNPAISCPNTPPAPNPVKSC